MEAHAEERGHKSVAVSVDRCRPRLPGIEQRRERRGRRVLFCSAEAEVLEMMGLDLRVGNIQTVSLEAH